MVMKTTNERQVMTAILRRGPRVLLCHRPPRASLVPRRVGPTRRTRGGWWTAPTST